MGAVRLKNHEKGGDADAEIIGEGTDGMGHVHQPGDWKTDLQRFL